MHRRPSCNRIEQRTAKATRLRHWNTAGQSETRERKGDGGHCTHGEAASGAPLDAELLVAGVLLRDQELGAGDEVREGVLLLEELPVLVPAIPHSKTNARQGRGHRQSPQQRGGERVFVNGKEALPTAAQEGGRGGRQGGRGWGFNDGPEAAHLAAAADVGDGKHKAAVDEREAHGGEVGVVADLVGSVAVEHQRVAAVELHEVRAVHEAYGDLREGSRKGKGQRGKEAERG